MRIGNWRQDNLLTFIYSLYKTNGDQPDTPPAGNAYVNLNPGKLVVYCDYSRFDDWTDKDCDGNVKKGYHCDPNLKLSEPSDDIWTGCKNTGTFLGNSGLKGPVVQVCISDKNRTPFTGNWQDSRLGLPITLHISAPLWFSYVLDYWLKNQKLILKLWPTRAKSLVWLEPGVG